MTNKQNSGIDIDLGNHCSRIAYNWAKKTFTHREPGTGNPLMSADGGFSSLMDFNGVKIGMSSDGIGTKIELAERTGIYNTIGFDLVAMVADDLAANGIQTVNLSNILDVDFLDSEIVDQLMAGLYEAAKFASITVTGGEIAELGSRIGGYGDRMHFNWCSTGIGILPEGKNLIDGKNIKAGDAVIALKSRGFRSNGFSLLRKIMENSFGRDWHNAEYENGKTWGEILLTHSLIYSPLITKLLKQNIKLNGIVHVTGGGLADNFSRILKVNQVGAILDNIFEPLTFMKKVQELGKVSEEQAYQLWNMGNGMLVILDRGQLKDALATIKQNDYQARECGQITDKFTITIESKGMQPERLFYSY
ncbi:MAG: AIR synthase-related protein [Calditrichaceae bacterium]